MLMKTWTWQGRLDKLRLYGLGGIAEALVNLSLVQFSPFHVQVRRSSRRTNEDSHDPIRAKRYSTLISQPTTTGQVPRGTEPSTLIRQSYGPRVSAPLWPSPAFAFRAIHTMRLFVLFTLLVHATGSPLDLALHLAHQSSTPLGLGQSCSSLVRAALAIADSGVCLSFRILALPPTYSFAFRFSSIFRNSSACVFSRSS